MRYFYSLLLYAMLPWVLLRLWLKGSQEPGYRLDWQQRFGFSQLKTRRTAVWIHAVSVGEVLAAQPLVRALREKDPAQAVLITTTTPGGRETVQRLFGSRVNACYLPYDLPGSVRRFLEAVQPARVIVMETEIWPNLYYQLRQRGIPLFLVNARLSRASFKSYQRFRSLMTPAIRSVGRIAAQSAQDLERFIGLGADREKVTVAGNLKFDTRLPADFSARVGTIRNKLGLARPIWIAGSTHQGEEQQLLAAHARLLRKRPQALLVIVPRHPQRARQVAACCDRAALSYQFYSGVTSMPDNGQVVIVDVLGELVYLYGAAGIAYLGGSLVAAGGHNPLEAILAGVPVLTGPYIGNFEAVYAQLVQSGAVNVIDTGSALADRIAYWFENDAQRKAAAAAGLQTIEQNRGALGRVLHLLEEV